MTAKTLVPNIRKGAAFLDKAYPEWYKHIYLDALDLARTDCCVLGQLSEHMGTHNRSYNHALNLVAPHDYDQQRAWAVEHGFNTPESNNFPDYEDEREYDLEYVLLTERWKRAIRRRRNRS